MLSPGEVVRIDGGERDWTITEASFRGDLNLPVRRGMAYYRVDGWPDPAEEIVGTRITGIVSRG